jgi:hypothetical protein
MAAQSNGNEFPWFTINEYLSKSITAGSAIDVSNISAVSFNMDVNLTVGSLATPFRVISGTPIGIDSSTHTIQIDVNAFMFAMG